MAGSAVFSLVLRVPLNDGDRDLIAQGLFGPAAGGRRAEGGGAKWHATRVSKSC
jgi:hypothetical protein